MQVYPLPPTPFQYASEVKDITIYLKRHYTFCYKQNATCSGTYTVHLVDYFSVRSVSNGNINHPEQFLNVTHRQCKHCDNCCLVPTRELILSFTYHLKLTQEY